MDTDRKLIFSNQVYQVADALCIFFANILAMWSWNLIQPFLVSLEWIKVDRLQINSIREIGTWFFLVIPLIPLCLELLGYYKIKVQHNFFRNTRHLVNAIILVNLLLFLYAVFFNIEIHRPFVLLLASFSIVLLLIRYLVVEKYSNLLSRNVVLQVLLIGKPEIRTEWEEELDSDIKDKINIEQKIDPLNFDADKLASIIIEKSIERVIILPKSCAYEEVSLAVETCELLGVESWVAVEFVKTKVAKPFFDSFSGRTMLVMKCIPLLSWSVLLKTIIDRFLAAVFLILGFPVICIAMLGIRLNSPGPVLFSQYRAGQYGRKFKIWKLRTMNIDAESQLSTIKKTSGNDMDGPVFKLTSDPRIFRWGSFLRATSIDELPQLWNVVRGEMSLVGPRPLPVYEVEAFENYAHRRRLSVKPGITCIWQVEGRNKITSFEDWVAMDLEYIDNWSLWLDIKILLKTFPAVLCQKGAK